MHTIEIRQRPSYHAENGVELAWRENHVGRDGEVDSVLRHKRLSGNRVKSLIGGGQLTRWNLADGTYRIRDDGSTYYLLVEGETTRRIAASEVQ